MLIHYLVRHGSNRLLCESEAFQSVTESRGNVARRSSTCSTLTGRDLGEGKVFAENGENYGRVIGTDDMLDPPQGSRRSSGGLDTADGASVGIARSVHALSPASATGTLDAFKGDLGRAAYRQSERGEPAVVGFVLQDVDATAADRSGCWIHAMVHQRSWADFKWLSSSRTNRTNRTNVRPVRHVHRTDRTNQ